MKAEDAGIHTTGAKALPIVAQGQETARDQIERDYVRWYPADIAPIDDTMAWPRKRIGLYVHIPFCKYRCHFCRYRVITGDAETRFRTEYLRALSIDLTRIATKPQLADADIDVLFIGGGTPSRLTEQELYELFEWIRSSFNIAADCEITVEGHPSSLDKAKLDALLALGVNRLSIGVQSLDDQILQLIGRDHSRATAYNTLRSAFSAGFNNVSIDIMYRLPGQDAEGFSRSLSEAISLGPTHLSLYPLWVREGSVLHGQLKREELILPDPSLEAEMIAAADRITAEAGLKRYNVFDFCTSQSTRSQYTLLQWEDGEWVGVGPSAVSYLGGRHMTNIFSVGDYVHNVKTGSSTIAAGNYLSVEDRMRRTMMFGLRMLPFRTERFRAQYGVDVDSVFSRELALLEEQGLITRLGGEIRLTQLGVIKVNNLGKIFYPDEFARQTLGVNSAGKPIEESDA